MPAIEIHTVNVPKDLHAFNVRINALFSELLGKPHHFCMVVFSKVDGLVYGTTDDPGFFVRVSSIGNIDGERNAKIVAAITEELVKELGVHPDRGYFGFYDMDPNNVGYKSSTFQKFLEAQE